MDYNLEVESPKKTMADQPPTIQEEAVTPEDAKLDNGNANPEDANVKMAKSGQVEDPTKLEADQ